jgi:hypothetical protein
MSKVFSSWIQTSWFFFFFVAVGFEHRVLCYTPSTFLFIFCFWEKISGLTNFARDDLELMIAPTSSSLVSVFVNMCHNALFKHPAF